MDWTSLFGLSVNPLELVVRGSAIYWFLFLILRVVLRRDVGAIGAADVLLIVLIADAAQNAMAGEYKSITDGCILIATIVGWNYLIDWAGFHSPRIAALLEAPPLLLVHHGRILHRNLRRELITTDELMSKLREQGIESVDQVKAARLESSGEVSVISTNASAGVTK
jgi:uncharacterized membrane protein YcaP (DUF421 family)